MKANVTTDRLPAVVDAPGFHKPTGEFTFTIKTPKKYEDMAKAFMDRVSSLGVFFFRPCEPEQIDAVLEQGNGPSPQPLSPEGRGNTQTADVETLALLLEMTERNVQLQVDNGLLVRADRGQYDMLGSYVGLWRAFKELQRGQNKSYNDERLEAMRLKRQERELDYYERAGKLGNIESIQRVIEKVKAVEKQQILFMPKQLAPQLEGDPAVNEVLLETWAHSFLKMQTEINLAVDIEKPAEPDQDKKPEVKKTRSRAKASTSSAGAPQRRKGKNK